MQHLFQQGTPDTVDVNILFGHKFHRISTSAGFDVIEKTTNDDGKIRFYSVCFKVIKSFGKQSKFVQIRKACVQFFDYDS